MKRPTLGHWIEYLGFRGASILVRALPERLALALGAALGSLACALRIRRGDVEENLARAFPDRSPKWRLETTRACYRHLGRQGAALLRLQGMDGPEIVERTRLAGFRELERALEEGKGALVVTGHLGNWEVGGACLAARGVPLDVVAVRQANPLFDAAIVGVRERLGMRVIERGRAPREVFRSLGEGRGVGFVADQDARRSGIFVDFFGVAASTARGPALFSIRTGAPLFLGLVLAEPGLRVRYACELIRIPVPSSGDHDRDVRTLTEAHTRGLEEAIRRTPAQYFWHHRRWKTRPEARSGGEEPAPGQAV